MSPHFVRYGHADVRKLVDEHPLAWVIAPGAPAAAACPLPMLGDYDTADALVGLVGHMGRGNPLVALLSENPRAQFLFTGPQAYVSPEHARRRNWGPTWNYAAVRVEAEVTLDAALTRASVERLVAASEAGRAQPWTPEALEGRYDAMLRAIIGFTARVTALDATFKLAQDEDDAVLGALVEGHPDPALRAWMKRMNGDRLE